MASTACESRACKDEKYTRNLSAHHQQIPVQKNRAASGHHSDRFVLSISRLPRLRPHHDLLDGHCKGDWARGWAPAMGSACMGWERDCDPVKPHRGLRAVPNMEGPPDEGKLCVLVRVGTGDAPESTSSRVAVQAHFTMMDSACANLPNRLTMDPL